MTPSVVGARELILSGKIIIVHPRTSFLVPSKSEPGTLHPVIVHKGISYCDCKGGREEAPCRHRLAAEYLSKHPGGWSKS